MKTHMTRGSLVRLVALATMWGSSFLLIKVAVDGVSPTQLVLGRLVAAAAVLLGIVAVARVPLPRALPVWGHLAVMGLVANIIPFFLFAWGEQRVTSGMAGILNGTTPLFTLAVAVAASNEEHLSPQRVAGLLLGFVGVVVVVGPWRGDGGANAISGQLACLVAAACYGVAFVYTRRFLSQRGLAPLALSAGQITLAAVMLGITAPFTARGAMTLTPEILGSIVGLGAVGTGLAYVLYYRIISDVGATTTSLVTYLIPVVAVFLGVAIQNDPLTWNIFAGAVIV
ncbi:MAG: EamA family transporter, partial [Nitriliruptorales bacterium]|nr:EamA family transporter [Nitriliruptorales bacterium]